MAVRYHKYEGPENLGEILSRLFTARGFGRRQARLHLERAWSEVAGEYASKTRVLALKRGILEIEATSAIVLQELAGFHKRRLLSLLKTALPSEKITDLRFRQGSS